MRITLKLFASLTDHLPAGGKDNQVELETGEGETVAQVIQRCQLPERLVHLVLVNGVYVAPGDRPVRQLNPGDQLAIWPPIAGG
ncbi:MAG: MoaD/ThiS family protein [Pseudomonadota bacterium]